MTFDRYPFDTVSIGYPIDTERHRPEIQTQTTDAEKRDREAEAHFLISHSAASARARC